MIFSPHSYDLGLLMLIQFHSKVCLSVTQDIFLLKAYEIFLMQSLMSYLPKLGMGRIFVFLIFPVSKLQFCVWFAIFGLSSLLRYF